MASSRQKSGARNQEPEGERRREWGDREQDSGHNPSISRQQLRAWMQQCRQLTLDLFEGVDYDTFSRQAHPDFSPIGWHLGHIAYTESLWLLEHCAGQPFQFPQYRRLYAADGLPKSERVNLPTLAETQKYLTTIREEVFAYLEVAPLEEQERLWCFLLQHESQHAETIALVLELIWGKGTGNGRRATGAKIQRSGARSQEPEVRDQEPGVESQEGKEEIKNWGVGARDENVPFTQNSKLKTPHFSTSSASEMVCVPAGNFVCGSDSIDALDNERPAHSVYLETYWIDPYPVTCGQFRLFMEAGGYQDCRWWSPEGWAWLQLAQVRQPLYWQNDPRWEDHPVCGVSWYEADAYARFAGKRLPTELEWEKAARWNPLTGQSQTYPWEREKGEGKGQKGKGETLQGWAIPDGTAPCNHSHQVGHTTPVTRYLDGKSPSGCYDMLGNVWEWTASTFDRYEGFVYFPYRGYSQTYFDGKHRVLRGGSWATRPWALRCSFRNWYHPHVREILAGFRCAISDSA